MEVDKMKSKILSVLKQNLMPESRSGANRDLHLELIKVLAAFLVVFYHYAYYKLDYGFVQGVRYFPNVTRVLMCFASCSVPLFFLVNGILMFRKERTLKNVYGKAIKIAILTVIWSFVGFPKWFFETLIILYLLFPIFQYIRKKSDVCYILICVAVFLMPFLFNFAVMWIKLAGIEKIGPVPVNGLHVTGCFTMYSILYFLIGPVLEKRKAYPLWVGMLFVIFGWLLVVTECTIYTNLNQAVYDGVNVAFPTVGALLLAVGVYMTVTGIKLEALRKPLIVAGGGILPIYLMHMVVAKSFHVEGNMPLWWAYLGTAVICAVCVIIGKLMQKIPVLCWFVKI